MPILEHIAELRNRLVMCVLVLVVTTIVAWVWAYGPALEMTNTSYCSALRSTHTIAPTDRCPRLGVLGPADAFTLRLRVALVLGVVLALPVIAYQIWRFVVPGLKTKEKRYAIPFALATTLLFALGVGMAVFALPRALAFLVGVGGNQLDTFFQADRYLRFVLFMALAFGAAFEFPLILVFLSMTGILSSDAMLAAWRPAVALIILAAAIITPSGDPVSLFAMAIPMWTFYFAAVAVAKFVIEPPRRRRLARELED